LQTARSGFARQADQITVEIEGLKLARSDSRRFGLRDHAPVGGEQLDPDAQWLELTLQWVWIIQVGPCVTQFLPARQPLIDPDIFVQVYVWILSSDGIDPGRMRAGWRLKQTNGYQRQYR
jgi:hypothetical protein